MYATKEKGITLIALIITIIVLIILAGISINLVLGENGILHFAKMAGEKQTKAQLKEELELAIVDMQAEKLGAGENFTRENLSKLSDMGAVIDSVTIPTIGEYKDYEFTIDENYVVTIGNKIEGAKPEITLSKDTEETVEKVKIHVTVTIAEGTVESVTKPDGTTTDETSFDYEVDENDVYTFVAQGSNGRRSAKSIMITNVKEVITNPVIESNYGYPILKISGVEFDGTTTITFDDKEGLENYYSLDGGSTWTRYTGPFNKIGTGTIMAKSERDGIILAEASKEVKMAEDALGPQAYDGDDGIYNGLESDDGTFAYWTGTKYIKVDESMEERKIRILYTSHQLTELELIFYDNNSNEISSKIDLEKATWTEGTQDVTIPKGTHKIGIYMTQWTQVGKSCSNCIYEIKILDKE